MLCITCLEENSNVLLACLLLGNHHYTNHLILQWSLQHLCEVYILLPHLTCEKNGGSERLSNLLNVTKSVSERAGDLSQVCLTLAPQTIIILARLYCLWFLPLLTRGFLARGVKSRWLFFPSALTSVTSFLPVWDCLYFCQLYSLHSWPPDSGVLLP